MLWSFEIGVWHFDVSCAEGVRRNQKSRTGPIPNASCHSQPIQRHTSGVYVRYWNSRYHPREHTTVTLWTLWVSRSRPTVDDGVITTHTNWMGHGWHSFGYPHNHFKVCGTRQFRGHSRGSCEAWRDASLHEGAWLAVNRNPEGICCLRTRSIYKRRATGGTPNWVWRWSYRGGTTEVRPSPGIGVLGQSGPRWHLHLYEPPVVSQMMTFHIAWTIWKDEPPVVSQNDVFHIPWTIRKVIISIFPRTLYELSVVYQNDDFSYRLDHMESHHFNTPANLIRTASRFSKGWLFISLEP